MLWGYVEVWEQTHRISESPTEVPKKETASKPNKKLLPGREWMGIPTGLFQKLKCGKQQMQENTTAVDIVDQPIPR